MKWQQFMKDYLVFSKKERIALFGVFIIISVIIFFPLLFSLNNKPVSINENDILKNAIDSVSTTSMNNLNEDVPVFTPELEMSVTESTYQGELFYFDPNTLSVEGWKRLGLKERTINTIKNYTNKGGKFYKPEDLKKIWGLDINFYERVKNHIVIDQKEKNQFGSASPYQRAEKKVILLNINTADSAQFIVLPGIGPRLSSRIISFREKLGGFHSVDQIAETYGLPDSTFQRIKNHFTVHAEEIKKISLNTASKDQLRSHPYINWNLANAIIEYKNQHGNYKSIEELKKIAIMNDEVYNKISPYLTL